MANKVKNSKIAYYFKDIYSANAKPQLLTTEDASLRLENNIVLRDHLFDVDEYNESGRLVPLKYVPSTKKASYFGTKALTTAKAGVQTGRTNTNNLLHTKAEEFLCAIDYTKLELGVFKVHSNYILEARQEVTIQFKDYSTGKLVVLRPDVVLSTPFQDFFIEIVVTHGVDDAKLSDYKAYRRYGDNEMPFTVLTIDLSDLHDIVLAFGYTDKVKEEVENRILHNTEYKKMLPIVTFNKSDAPFGRSTRTGLPYRLVVNTSVDGVDRRLRSIIEDSETMSSSISIQSYDTRVYDDNDRFISVDRWHMLYLTDDSPETPLYGLTCFKHPEHSLRLVLRADGNRSFIKCQLNEKGEESECDFTVSFFDKSGLMQDEYLVLGDLSNLLIKNNTAIDRLKLYRSNINSWRM